jgi:ATP-dependent Clp protease ATP-binding subunit ClpA
MRLHGEVGTALEALGVSEGPIGEGPEGLGQSADPERAGGSTDSPAIDPEESVWEVTERASHIATQRGAEEIATTDVLMAVMHVYGTDFDRVLRAHGTDSDALIEQLGGGALASRES